MRKRILFKAVFSMALAAVLAVALVSAVTPTVQGMNCMRSFLGCSFSHFETFGTAGGCCAYRCEDGSIRHGLCFQGILE